MKAIILAGGKGTRLYPVTLETPKPLLTVKKKPIVNYLIDMFRAHGVKEIKVIIPKDHIEDYDWWVKRYGDQFGGVDVSFEVEHEPMGTFGTMAHSLADWVGTEDFFLTNGDELKSVDLKEMMALHKKMDADATIALAHVNNPKDYGVAVCDNYHIKEFIEKPQDPPSNYISSGLYLLSPRVFEYVWQDVEDGKKFLMIEKDVFPKIAKALKLAGYKFDGKWYDCGTIQRWETAIKNWTD
jgi:NDP-sugar pyrophosphorylase family protein